VRPPASGPADCSPSCLPFRQLYTTNYRFRQTAVESWTASLRSWLTKENPAAYHPNLELSRAFVRRSEQPYRRHRGDRGGGRVGSHDLFAALPEIHPIYPPNSNLIVPRRAPAAHVTIRSLAVASSANGRLDSHFCLSLKGREGADKVCGKQLVRFRRAQFPVLPVGLKKKKICSTIGFGRTALKASPICRPAPSNNDKNDQVYNQILPLSVVHQCFRHPRLMFSVGGCQDPGPNIWRWQPGRP